MNRADQRVGMNTLVAVIVVGTHIIDMLARTHILVGISGFHGRAHLHVVAIDAIACRSGAGRPAEVDIAAACFQTEIGGLGGLSENSVDSGQGISATCTRTVVLSHSVFHRQRRGLQEFVYLGRCEIGVGLQHQSHDARNKRCSHRSASHDHQSAVVFIIARKNI